jgi:hypothetical protein
MEQAMTIDDKTLRRAVSAHAKWHLALHDVYFFAICAVDALVRGEDHNSWEYLFRAQEAADRTQEAFLEWSGK